MNWEDIGKTLIGLGAPILGTALGGPLGGIAGKVLADQLGVDSTPAAVGAALQNDPQVAITAANAETEWAKTAAAFATASAQQGQAINETMRAEIAGGQPWYHWRNLQAYELFCFECPTAFSGALYIVGSDLIKNDFLGVSTFVTLGTAMILPYLYARLAICGYVAQDSNKMKATAITGEHAPSIFGSLITAFGKK